MITKYTAKITSDILSEPVYFERQGKGALYLKMFRVIDSIRNEIGYDGDIIAEVSVTIDGIDYEYDRCIYGM